MLLLNTVEDLDPKRIQIYDRPFSLAQDLEILEDAIKRMQAVLVIIDPLMAVLGNSIDSSRDQSVRDVFTPLAQLAERTGCAILMIRHLSRGSAGHPLYRGAGSIGIIAAARSGLIVAADPADEHRHILAPTKHNLSQPASNLTYQVVENAQGVPYIHWLEENHHPVQALLSPPALSYERRAILKALQESSTPLHPGEVANRTGLNHTNLRKMLPRLFHAGEIASPARGLYTALAHTNLPANLPENKDIPTETYVSNVPNVSNDESTPIESSAHTTETYVPNVPNVSNDELTPNDNSAITTETYGSSPLCVQGESCREAAGALISSIADACDGAQRRAQGYSLDSLQPQQKPFGATSDRWRDPLCELACVLRSRCTQSDEEPTYVSNVSNVSNEKHTQDENSVVTASTT